jgi:hypothetical protein
MNTTITPCNQSRLGAVNYAKNRAAPTPTRVPNCTTLRSEMNVIRRQAPRSEMNETRRLAPRSACSIQAPRSACSIQAPKRFQTRYVQPEGQTFVSGTKYQYLC